MASGVANKRGDFFLGGDLKASIIYDSLTEAGRDNENDVMSGPCRLTHIRVKNGDAAILYLKLFDNVNPTLGTTAPDFVFMIPSSGTQASFDIPVNGGAGIKFNNGLSYAIVTTGGTGGTAGPTAATLLVLQAIPGVS